MDMTTSPAALTSPTALTSTAEHTGQKCGILAEHLARIGDRWTLPVVVTLREGPLRFNQLRRAVAGISQQMLTRTLRALERDGMVDRTVRPTVPPQVEYALTDTGASLAEQGVQLGNWVLAHMAAIEQSRSVFDERETE